MTDVTDKEVKDELGEILFQLHELKNRAMWMNRCTEILCGRVKELREAMFPKPVVPPRVPPPPEERSLDGYANPAEPIPPEVPE